MYKKIPGNEKYRINLNKEIIDEDNNKIVFKKDDTIKLYNVDYKINLDFLALMAWYEMGTIPNLYKYFRRIKFSNILNVMLRIRSGKQMYFTKPIYYNEKYRIIPNFTNYAIDINGTVLNITTNTIETNIYENKGYTSIYIYNPDRSTNKHVRIHRLLAMAWLENDDYLNRPYINHIDGVKSNNKLSNLEWVSHLENNLHARSLGLNKDQIPTKVRDFNNGKIHVFNSATELAIFLGTTSIKVSDYYTKLPGYLFAKRYEIKRLDDETPWYYESVDRELFTNYKNVHIIKVFDKSNGKTKIFNNARYMAKFYKLNGLRDKSIDFIISEFKNLLPDLEITYTLNITKGPYSIYNLLTKEITIVNSIAEIANIINIKRSKIQSDLKRKYKYIYLNTYIIYIGTDFNKININEYINSPEIKKVEVKNISTNNIIIYDSIRNTARKMNIARDIIKNRIKTGKEYNGFIYRTL